MSWVIRLALTDAESLAPLRLTRGIEVAGGNRLRNLESRIPAEMLPALNWQPVSAWLRVRMLWSPPERKFMEKEAADYTLSSVPLRIVRSSEERPIALLMTSLADWREFALNAPEIR